MPMLDPQVAPCASGGCTTSSASLHLKIPDDELSRSGGSSGLKGWFRKRRKSADDQQLLRRSQSPRSFNCNQGSPNYPQVGLAGSGDLEGQFHPDSPVFSVIGSSASGTGGGGSNKVRNFVESIWTRTRADPTTINIQQARLNSSAYPAISEDEAGGGMAPTRSKQPQAKQNRSASLTTETIINLRGTQNPQQGLLKVPPTADTYSRATPARRQSLAGPLPSSGGGQLSPNAAKHQHPQRRSSVAGTSNLRHLQNGSAYRQTVGPEEFLQMYRQRAYSDSKQLQQRRKSGAPAPLSPQQLLTAPPKSPTKLTPPMLSPNGNAVFNMIEPQQVVIWRDKDTGTQILRLPNMEEEYRMENDELGTEDEVVFAKFMRAHKCYDLIPSSSKIVSFDTCLDVKIAFFALVNNGIRAAPLWDSAKKDFVGMLTITDFIKILHRNYSSSAVDGVQSELESQKLEKWKEISKDKQMISISPDATLLEAIEKLCLHKIHRLLVMDDLTGDALYSLTHKRILRFLFLYIDDLPTVSFLQKTLHELQLGTYSNIATAFYDTLLIDALSILLERRISAIPIVNEEGKLIDIYSKFDVINLAEEKTYNNLDMTLENALKYRKASFQGLHKCLPTEALSTVLDRIVKTEAHRLVVVDEEDHVKGIVSLSDVLSYLVLRPATAAKQDFERRRGSGNVHCIILQELTKSSASSNV